LYADEAVRPEPIAESVTTPNRTPAVQAGRWVEVRGVPGYLYTDEHGVDRVRMYGSLDKSDSAHADTIDVPIPTGAQDPAASELEFKVKLGGFEARGSWGAGSEITELERHMSINTLQGAAQVLAAESGGAYADQVRPISKPMPKAIGQNEAIALEVGSVPAQAEWGEVDEAETTTVRGVDLAKNAKEKASVAGAKLSEMSKEVDWNTVSRRLGKAAKIWLIAGTSMAAFSTVEGIPAAGLSLFGIGQPNPYSLNADPMHDAQAIATGPVAGGKAVVRVGKGIMHIVGVL
jgi:hypothetical protein